MKIQFERLGPMETVTYHGYQYKNGDIVEMEEGHAKAYLQAKLAVEVTDAGKAMERIRLEAKNAEVREKAKKDSKAVKELDDAIERLAAVKVTGGKE